MSIFTPGLEKALNGQKQALINEAEKAGATILQIEDVTDAAENAGKRVMGSSAKALFGGKVQADGFQLFVLETDGIRHAYVQPFNGGLPLPGEHHVILDGALPGPLNAAETFLASEWISAENPAFAKQLNSDPTMKKLVKKLEWSWPMGTGKITLKWTAQAKTDANGNTHFVMKSGRYGGVMTYEVGFAVFVGMLRGLVAHVGEAGSETLFAHPAAYGGLALQLLGADTDDPSDIQPSEPVKQARDVDYRSVIRDALAGKVGKRIFVGDIPDKKRNNARKGILPASATDVEIVALLDGTIFKSAKAGAILTPDAFYVRDEDRQFGFALRDLQMVGANSGGNVNVKVAVKGELSVPGGIEEDALRDVLKAIADANR